MTVDTTTISQILAEVGTSGIFVFLFFLVWNDSKKERQESKKERELKDERLEKLTSQLMEKYEENTKVMARVEATLDKNTSTINENTDTNKTLSDRIYQIILPKSSRI